MRAVTLRLGLSSALWVILLAVIFIFARRQGWTFVSFLSGAALVVIIAFLAFVFLVLMAAWLLVQDAKISARKKMDMARKVSGGSIIDIKAREKKLR